MAKQIVIYTRFSSELQRTESCADQQRKVREGLDRLGVEHAGALVLEDHAESGTNETRPSYTKLRRMIRGGEVAVLAVDDQSRLSRSDQVKGVIDDLVYADGRFISTGEGIDTREQGWELKVGLMGLHHATSNRETARRVRRGQEGRVLDGDGSAGDFPFGYRSEYVDPNWQQMMERRVKPKKRVVIDPVASEVVRRVFQLFAHERLSMSEIARRFNREGVVTGSRVSTSRWRASTLTCILHNRKYIGEWSWGRTEVRRNAEGKKRQVAVDTAVKKPVCVNRPNLRIIDDELWHATQVRLAEGHQRFGARPGQKKRGSRVHPRDLYPATPLSGLIHCAKCGSVMIMRGSRTKRYLHCPGHTRGTCDVRISVPYDAAYAALTGVVHDLLHSSPEEIGAMVEAFRKTLDQLKVTDHVAADRQQIPKLEAKLSRLVDALADGQGESTTIRSKITQIETELNALQLRVQDGDALETLALELPEESWFRDQLTGIGKMLEQEPEGRRLLRDLLGRVEAGRCSPSSPCPPARRGSRMAGCTASATTSAVPAPTPASAGRC